jgi:xanthine dehydrogenase YagS FAD-binding subunit
VATARVVFSGVAPMPWRSLNVEQALLGHVLDAKTIAKAADASVVGARPLAQNAYKLDMLRGLVSDELSKISLP